MRRGEGGLTMPDVRVPRSFPLYVLRHGETEWNVAQRMQGSLNSPLTARGRVQAAEMARLLAAELGDDWPPVYASPQPRALETARIVTAGRTAPRLDERLRELTLGGWEGMTLADIEAARPGFFAASDPFFWRFNAPGGERYDMFAARVGSFLDELEGGAILVTHGIVSRVLRGLALGLAPDELGDRLPGGQGVIHVVADGRHRTL